MPCTNQYIFALGKQRYTWITVCFLTADKQNLQLLWTRGFSSVHVSVRSQLLLMRLITNFDLLTYTPPTSPAHFDHYFAYSPSCTVLHPPSVITHPPWTTAGTSTKYVRLTGIVSEAVILRELPDRQVFVAFPLTCTFWVSSAILREIVVAHNLGTPRPLKLVSTTKMSTHDNNNMSGGQKNVSPPKTIGSRLRARTVFYGVPTMFHG